MRIRILIEKIPQSQNSHIGSWPDPAQPHLRAASGAAAVVGPVVTQRPWARESAAAPMAASPFMCIMSTATSDDDA